MSVFCRHNRFTADCPICSKGTVLEPGRATRRRSPSSAPRKRASTDRATAPAFSGPHVASPAYRDDDGVLYVIRLERVPGGVRLGEWRGAALVPRAPVLPGGDLVDLVGRAGEALQARDAAQLIDALAAAADVDAGDGPAAGRAVDAGAAGVSRGRSGDFKEELRVEALEDGRLRVARWVLRPAVGWELQDAPPMLPAARYAEAIAGAVRAGLLAPRGAPTPAA